MTCVALATAVTAATSWRDAPEYLAIFAPPAQRTAYHASMTAAPLEAVLADLEADPSLVRVPGAWSPRAQAPLDVFGRGGTYDRWKLARLYGARQPRVARGARMRDGQVVESWTLVSPYPTPDLARLEPGTLRIILSLEKLN